MNFHNLKKTIKEIKGLENELSGSNKMNLLKKSHYLQNEVIKGIALLTDISFKVKREGGWGRLILRPVYFCLFLFSLFVMFI